MKRIIPGSLLLLLVASCVRLSGIGGVAPRSVGTDGCPNENHAISYPDFTIERYMKDVRPGTGGLVMDYKVGDRFRLRQPMFLVYADTGIVQLRYIAHTHVPKLSDYKKNADAYRYGGRNRHQVIRLVPAGTVIRIVKIADIDVVIPLFVFEGEVNWFRCAAFASNRNIEYTAERIVLLKSYDKELFTKL